MFALMRETYSVKILERKTRRLRKETGNQDLVSKLDSGLTRRDHLQRALLLPLRMLFLSPIVLIFSTYMAMVYGYLYLMFTTLTEVFERVYGFSTGTVGLVYLGLGCGMLIGLFIFGAVSKISAKKLAGAGDITPESRLPLMIPGALCVPIGLFIYGWTVQYHVFWFVPIFGSALVGIGLISTFVGHTSILPLLILTVAVANFNVLGGYIHHLLCFCTGSEHCVTFFSRSFAASCGPAYVCKARIRMGKLLTGVYCAGHVSFAVLVLEIRGVDSD
jgi:hypothetical protein